MSDISLIYFLNLCNQSFEDGGSNSMCTNYAQKFVHKQYKNERK